MFGSATKPFTKGGATKNRLIGLYSGESINVLTDEIICNNLVLNQFVGNF